MWSSVGKRAASSPFQMNVLDEMWKFFPSSAIYSIRGLCPASDPSPLIPKTKSIQLIVNPVDMVFPVLV